MTPEQFVAKYAGVRLTESALYASHFNDLCGLTGHPQPVEMDRVGETFTFQKGVIKTPLSPAEGGGDVSPEAKRSGEGPGVRGGRGFADVWYRGHFAFEYKTPGKEPKRDPRVKAIAKAARELNEKRESWLNPYGHEDRIGLQRPVRSGAEKSSPAIREELKSRTLTKLYNDMPEWLRLAHAQLDRAVLDAYGWPHDLSDDDILARLLEENLKREAAK